MAYDRGVWLLTQAIFGTKLPEDVATDGDIAAMLQEQVTGLGPYLAGVMILRFGLSWPVPYDARLRPVDNDPVNRVHTRTLAAVGRHFGVTGGWVRQLEKRAIRVLRHPSRSKQLRELLKHGGVSDS